MKILRGCLIVLLCPLYIPIFVWALFSAIVLYSIVIVMSSILYVVNGIWEPIPNDIHVYIIWMLTLGKKG